MPKVSDKGASAYNSDSGISIRYGMAAADFARDFLANRVIATRRLENSDEKADADTYTHAEQGSLVPCIKAFDRFCRDAGMVALYRRRKFAVGHPVEVSPVASKAGDTGFNLTLRNNRTGKYSILRVFTKPDQHPESVSRLALFHKFCEECRDIGFNAPEVWALVADKTDKPGYQPFGDFLDASEVWTDGVCNSVEGVLVAALRGDTDGVMHRMGSLEVVSEQAKLERIMSFAKGEEKTRAEQEDEMLTVTGDGGERVAPSPASPPRSSLAESAADGETDGEQYVVLPRNEKPGQFVLQLPEGFTGDVVVRVGGRQ